MVFEEDNNPWTMARLTDDQAAEFNPKLMDADNDTLLAVWTRVDGDVSGAQSPEDIAPHLEIVTSWYNRTSDIWSTPVQLTTNNSVDRNPLPIMFGENQGVLWIQNQGLAMIGDVTQVDSLMYQPWSGSSWTAPVTLWSGQKGILEFTFAADDQGQVHVVLSVDEDGDPETRFL